MSFTKICSKCDAEKDLSEFHKNKNTKDGYFAWCKICRSLHYKGYNKKYYQTSAGKASSSRNAVTHRKRHRKAHNARRYAEQAVKTGKIIKPDHCEHCPATGYLEKHHEDYNKPLEVVWLCISCHRKADKKRQIRETTIT